MRHTTTPSNLICFGVQKEGIEAHFTSSKAIHCVAHCISIQFNEIRYYGIVVIIIHKYARRYYEGVEMTISSNRIYIFSLPRRCL